MSEVNENKDESENDNAPIPPKIPVRESLVATAVNFLQNPKVQSSHMSQKRTFLQKKGLTEEEIDLAFQRLDTTTTTPTTPSHHQYPPVMPRELVPYEMYKPSIWTRINKFGSSVIIIGITLYGFHQFYKLYIEPWLFGNKRQEDRVSELEKQLLDLNQSLNQLKNSISSIEESLNSQKEQHKSSDRKNIELEDAISPSFFMELKADISTVKSLLLSRHQFPEIPKISPTIPSWQLVNGSSGKMTESDVVIVENESVDDENKEQPQTSTEDVVITGEDQTAAQKLSSDENAESTGTQEEAVSTHSASSDSFEHCSSAV